MKVCVEVHGELRIGERGWPTLRVWPWSPLKVYKGAPFFGLEKREWNRTLNTPCTHITLKRILHRWFLVCTRLTTEVIRTSESRWPYRTEHVRAMEGDLYAFPSWTSPYYDHDSDLWVTGIHNMHTNIGEGAKVSNRFTSIVEKYGDEACPPSLEMESRRQIPKSSKGPTLQIKHLKMVHQDLAIAYSAPSGVADRTMLLGYIMSVHCIPFITMAIWGISFALLLNAWFNGHFSLLSSDLSWV